MPELAEPQKELRFTRASQAVGFWLLAAVATMGAITLGVVSCYRAGNPELPGTYWALIPLAIAIGAVRLAIHLNRHAYLILTPLGIDIFPFLFPAKNMRTVFWQQVRAIDIDPRGNVLTLHFDQEKNSGIHLSLRPLGRQQRRLIVRALEGRIEMGKKA